MPHELFWASGLPSVCQLYCNHKINKQKKEQNNSHSPETNNVSRCRRHDRKQMRIEEGTVFLEELKTTN